MGKFAGWFLQAGRIILSGKVPNHQHFVANPYRMWMVTESKANLEGKDLGRIGPLKEQAHLEDFWIPQKGILALGKTYFDLYDPQTHLEPSMKKTELF